MRQVTQIQQLTNIIPGQNDFDVNVKDGNDTILVIAGNDFLQYLSLRYYEWSFFSQGDTKLEWYASLKSQFDLYMKEQGDALSDIYEALTTEYDPISDYSRNVKKKFKNSRTVDNTPFTPDGSSTAITGKSVTTSYDNYQKEISYGKKDEVKVATFESATVDKPLTESGLSNSDSETYRGSMTVTQGGMERITDVGLEADNQTSIVGTNTSPSTNIEEEIKLRLKYDFTDIVLNDFATRYLFLLA